MSSDPVISLIEPAIFFAISLRLWDGPLWTVHVILSIAAMISLKRRGLGGFSTKLQFGTICLILIVSTFVTAASLYTLYARVDGYLAVAGITDGRLSTGSAYAGLLKAAVYLSDTGGILTFIADAVVVWRAFIIWSRHKLILAIPIFFIVAGLGLSMTSITLSLQPAAMDQSILPNSSPIAITSISGLVSSVAANAFATAMIGFQGYEHRKLMTQAFGSRSSFRTLRIIFFLTEAGVIYLILQIVSFSLNMSTMPGDQFTPLYYIMPIWINITFYVSISYPSIVVLMVHHRLSLASDAGIDGKVPTIDAGTHISFARDGTYTQNSGFRNDDGILTNVDTGTGELDHNEREVKGRNVAPVFV